MAWQAIMTGYDLDAPSVTVGYYDDADPVDSQGNHPILLSQSFTRNEFGTLPQLKAAVIQIGQQKRAAYQRVQQIKNAGAVTIP